jgi:hypothetical protein
MYSLAKTEEIICGALEIPSKKRSAFSSKLKYYRKQNFPKLPKTGKGSRSEFSLRAVLQAMTVFRLEQLGFRPKFAIRGALAASDIITQDSPRPANPYLCFDGEELSIVSGVQAHEFVDKPMSVNLVSINELSSFLTKGLALVSPDTPSVGGASNITEHIYEHRDGIKWD